MSDELLPWYNAELRFIRRMGQIFARDNPQIAARLGLGSDVVEDPHVSRLIESFAYLNARTRYKIDDDFPEITEAYLNILYPHYLAPLPSMAIAKFELSRTQAQQTDGQLVPAETAIETPSVQGHACQFRTNYPVQLWPFEVEVANLRHGSFRAPKTRWLGESSGVLNVSLKTLSPAAKFSDMPMSSLRFFLKAQPPDVYQLYELLFTGVLGIGVANGPDDASPVQLDRTAIKPVGFAVDEGMLPYSSRSFVGYRLLTEYFAFPEKFLFVDIDLAAVDLGRFENSLQLYFYLDQEQTQLESAIEPDVFQTGCTPIINLFDYVAEPIKVTGTDYETRVVANARMPRAFEVYSIDDVVASSGAEERRSYVPFYSFRHGNDESADDAYYYAARRDTDDPELTGSDMWLSLVDLNFQPDVPEDWTLRINTTCFNRDMPRELPFGTSLPMQLTGAAAGITKVECITRPTKTRRPALGQGTRWRLISHLNLNGLSLSDGENGGDALREFLKIYDFVDSTATREAITGLKTVTTRRATGRVTDTSGLRKTIHFCRGIETDLHFDEENFTGGGVFLFAGVLERFLALYCSINSFVRTTATTEQREEVLYQWPARTGDQLVL
jgi:type VI secretion system protein ImpG